MTVLQPFRRAAAILAACAVLVAGVVALVASQSQPARAASIGDFTIASGGSLSDPEPLGATLGIPAACPDVTIEDINWNSHLNLYLVKADGTEATVLRGVSNGGPYTQATPSISLAAADNPGMEVQSLADIVTSDGTYELRAFCVDNYDFAKPSEEIVPGNPYWTQKITVTGDTWAQGEGAEATSTELTYSPSQVEPGQTVKLTATVTPSEATGNVTFLDGDTSLGDAAVANGKAELTTPALDDGPHDFTARFVPANTAEWGASESEPVRLVVQLPRVELHNAQGERLPDVPELERGQQVKLVVRRCTAGEEYTLALDKHEADFPKATADPNGTVTWASLTVPEDAVAGDNAWKWTPACDGGANAQASFTLAEPSGDPSGEPSDDPSGDPTDDPSGDPTDDPTGDPTDDPSGDTSGTTSGTTGGDTGGSTGGDTGGNSPQGGGGGLASTGSQIALFSGIGAIVLVAAGIFAVRFGRRNGLLSFGEPRA
ncbi:Ig-like domain-containing protein [Streptomyces sp. NPDC089424]|uniref:Ig-like domain-containing protein n=1 Tax=Streptomyces sp. NPDC089424 TaxID=3365917 RepID=UPI0038292680